MTAEVSILHIVQWLSRGGASRAMWGTAKHTRSHARYKHYVVSLMPAEPEAVSLVEEAGLTFIPTSSYQEVLSHYQKVDIVQIEWWNTPQMDAFLREPQPPCRMLFWYHVQGHTDPQFINPAVVSMADIAIASSPVCMKSPSFDVLSEEEKEKKLRLVYDAADFDRLSHIERKPHHHFNVGFIGTLSFIKMHPDYIRMSAAIDIEQARFVVCGGDNLDVLKRQAKESGKEQKFVFKGYVEDIKKEIELFDVYGYPLCEDTYASAELNLQEVMFAGIPPIVFPYGGIKELVIHEETGLIVHSETEYKEAIEYLYKHPEVRRKLGDNAAAYARNVFGAENAARTFHDIYQEAMKLEASTHVLCQFPESPPVPYSVLESYYPKKKPCFRFIDSLGTYADLFLDALSNDSIEESFEIEKEIGALSTLMRDCGINWFRDFYPGDPHLAYWSGIAHFYSQQWPLSLMSFLRALENQIEKPQIDYYIALAALHCGRPDIAETYKAKVLADSNLSFVHQSLQSSFRHPLSPFSLMEVQK